MVYLLLKIAFCLLLAGMLGAIIGWLLKRVFAQKHHDEQQQHFDIERKQHKKDLTQVESNWNSKYQSLNTTRNKIQGLLDTNVQENTLLSQSVKTTQQTLNDQGKILTHLQGDMSKLSEAKDDLQNKNSLLAQEVVNLRNENKQIATLEDNIIQLNNIQSSLKTTLKETKAANETTNTHLLKKYHDLEKNDIALKIELNTAMDERDHAKHTLAQLKTTTVKEQQKSDELIIEKQQLLSIQHDEAKQQSKNSAIIITLKSTLEKTKKDNIALKEEVTTLQQKAADIPTLNAKSNALEKDKKKLEEKLQGTHNDAEKIKQFKATIDLLKTDNAILKKDNQENNQQNIKINHSLSNMTSEIERYKRYLVESEKTWAAKIYELQKQSKTAEDKQQKTDTNQLEALKKQLKILSKKHIQLTDTLAKNEKSASNDQHALQTGIKQLKTELDNTKSSAKSDKKQLQEKINQLNTESRETKQLKEKINQLNDTLNNTKASSTKDTNKLQDKINQLNDALKKARKFSEKNTNKLQEKINQLNEELKNMKSSSSDDKKQLQIELNQLNNELDKDKISLKNDKKQLQETVNQLNTELDNTKLSLINNRNEKEQLQTNVIQLNKKLSNTQSSSAKEKNRLQEEINQLDNEQEKAHIAQQAMDNCKQKLTVIENDNTQLNKTLKNLTAQNDHTEKSLSTTQQDYIDLSEEHEAVKLELKQLHQQKPKVAEINKARADDLQKIKGIGKHNERILNKLGITHYAQIARFTQQDEEKFGKELGVFASRISQEAWVGQAKILHQDKYSENT
jgi:predicted flap endonuclease-1-like 5' DNA nuclease